MNNRNTQKGGIITALVYTRVSSEEQERDGLSLPSQLMDCRQYASDRGWVIGAEFTDTMSGKRDDRPSYVAMLAEARQRRVQGQSVVVVVKWLHRLGRKVLERARSWEELDHLSVQVHSVAEGGAVPKLVADVLAAVAEEKSRQIGERVSATLQHTASSAGGRSVAFRGDIGFDQPPPPNGRPAVSCRCWKSTRTRRCRRTPRA